ncbi:helix-turn-helix domain-containing protein [Chryseobacterium lathyri]|uniref:Transposase n=1 Tax=Chryseobacterium lathyri TaxID=395933 RepID=A0A511YFU7_9FLAO|nr:helix-turn-helix domain-containing protein [Chryseobacterium lathyri]GEN74043.1 hypothetical protein CLA01_41150 [Chryseobacterium lathyri]
MKTPNYQKIYQDLLKFKGLDKEITIPKLEKSIDIIRFNDLISKRQKEKRSEITQHAKSYDEESILMLLRYQKKNNLNNTQLANEFRLSRNSVSKWKKIYQYKI